MRRVLSYNSFRYFFYVDLLVLARPYSSSRSVFSSSTRCFWPFFFSGLIMSSITTTTVGLDEETWALICIWLQELVLFSVSVKVDWWRDGGRCYANCFQIVLFRRIALSSTSPPSSLTWNYNNGSFSRWSLKNGDLYLWECAASALERKVLMSYFGFRIISDICWGVFVVNTRFLKKKSIKSINALLCVCTWVTQRMLAYPFLQRFADLKVRITIWEVLISCVF